MERPSETPEYHARIMSCSLEVEHCRSYWQHVANSSAQINPEIPFGEYWFGARSLPRVQVLLTNLRARFDQFPEALQTLHQWNSMDALTRQLICHWHLQLSDRLYREFTGQYLPDRASRGRTDVTRDLVVRWIEQVAPDRWTTSTKIQYARKLLFSAVEAGLLKGSRDPRSLQVPRPPDHALAYILYLLRSVDFQGTIACNPYLNSVGLSGLELERRLRVLPACGFRKQGDLMEFAWRYESLSEWAKASVLLPENLLRDTA